MIEPGSLRPSDHEELATERISRVVAAYVDRLNAGDRIDPLEVIASHPGDGEQILERLEAFVGLVATDDNKALGTLGDYTLRRQIGRGGMGVVYEAWQSSMDRRVALKVMPKAVAVDTKAVTRFIQEAQLAGKLNHPNIVHVHGMGVEQQVPYYAMDFVEGETLAQVLVGLKETREGEETPFGKKHDARYFLNITEAFADVADGLQHAHSKRIIHRDIKPSNLILDKDARLRILDFGLARLEGQESLTISGDMVGTPLYMSPEQARRRTIPIDHRTDIYSLGATLYEMVTLEPPFRGKDHADTLSQIIERDPSPPTRINPRVPRDLETILLKCLRKEPADRFGTAEALAQDLRRFLRGDPIEARPEARWARVLRSARQSRARIVVAALLLVLLTASGLLLRGHLREVQARNEAKARAAVMALQMGVHFAGENVANASTLDPSYLKIAEKALSDLEEAAAALPKNPGIHYQLAKGLLTLLRLPEAQAEIDRALSLKPDFVPAKTLRASILESQGDSSAAEAELHRLEASTGPAWGKPWLAAYRSTAEGRFQDAVDAYTQLSELERAGPELYLGSSIEFLFGTGRAHLETRDYLRAIVDFTKADVLWPDSIEPGLLRGKAYYLLGRKDLAEEEFSNLHSRSNAPERAALFVWGIYFRFHENIQKEVEWSQKLPAGVLREIANIAILHNMGKWDEAERASRKAIEMYPDSVDLRQEFVKLLEDFDRFEEAQEHLERIIEREPRSAVASAGLARALQEQGKTSDAITACRKALEIDPRCISALIVLGRSLSDAGNLPEAVRTFERAHRLCPRSRVVQHHWGAKLMDHGLYEEAAAMTSRGLEIWPTNPHGYRDLGQSLLGLGRTEEAIEACRKALEVAPGFVWAFPLLGDALEKAGRLAEACDTYAEALILRPRETAATKRLVSLLRREGKGLRGRASLSRLVPALEAELEQGKDLPLFLMALGLAKLSSPAAGAEEAALDYALRGVEKSEALNDQLPLLAAALEDLLASVVETRSPAVHGIFLLHRLPPYAALDRILEAGPIRDEEAAGRILEKFRHLAEAGGDARLAYLEGRILDRLGRHGEAVEKLRAAVALEKTRPEPLLGLARCLRAGGEPASAAEALRSALEAGELDHPSLWELWASVSFADLRKTPAEMLSGFPGASADSYGDDLHWLSEKLAAKEPIRIRCGGEEYLAKERAEFAKDRFFIGGVKAGPFQVRIANTQDEPLYQCERWFGADGSGPAGYRFPLPPGRYRVSLHFAEVWWHAPGLRKFDVAIEGRKVLDDYEPFAAGFATARQETREITLEDGLLEIEFRRKVDNPKVSAIEIEKLD